MAACRLAAKGRPLSDYSYESEVKSIKAFLEMQHPSVVQAPVISPSSLDIAVEEYVPHRFTKKLKGKVRCATSQRILITWLERGRRYSFFWKKFFKKPRRITFPKFVLLKKDHSSLNNIFTSSSSSLISQLLGVGRLRPIAPLIAIIHHSLHTH